MKNLILATAGHVDHGKSELVKSLTGTDPDRLPEEKKRRISIELGFAELEITGKTGEKFHIGVVDVPGHEDFVKSMVAGVGSVDLCLLVVAADDGWMPQTEEHLQILTYLGLRRGVVALTKADLVNNHTTAIRETREKLWGTFLEQAPIVACSAHYPASFEPLRCALADICAKTAAPAMIGKPRMPVDRAFILAGVGTVVTGTLTGGSLERGQTVGIQPDGMSARIRSIQSHHRELEKCGPGNRVALNLSGVSVRTHRGETGVRRGDIIALPEAGTACRKLDVELCRLERAKHVHGMPTLRSGSLVRVHYGSANTFAHVHFFEGQELAAGQRALAQLAFTTPVFAFVGDRMVVRDGSGRWTLAGAVVLDITSPTRTSQERKAIASARRRHPMTAELLLETELVKTPVAKLDQLLKQSRLSNEEISIAAQGMASAGMLLSRGEYLLQPNWWRDLVARAAALVDQHHRAHPEHTGLDVSTLRSRLGVDAHAADMLLEDLCREGFLRRDTMVARLSHRPALPPSLEKAGSRLRAQLLAKPFDPPSRHELTADTTSYEALKFLLSVGEAVEISKEIVMDACAFERARRCVEEWLRAGSTGTASELRKALQTSRRVVIPLLERLDRDGLTRREGDRRVLRSSS